MRALANIELPIHIVQEVGYTEVEALDFLFDMNVPNICDILSDQVRLNLPGIAVVRSTTHQITALLYFKPPLGIRLVDEQKYIIFVGRDLKMLLKYFEEWSDFNTDIYLNPILSSICNILRSKCGKPLKIKATTEAI
jgi:hypothetical protein